MCLLLDKVEIVRRAWMRNRRLSSILVVMMLLLLLLLFELLMID
jgi:hypothetical protein